MIRIEYKTLLSNAAVTASIASDVMNIELMSGFSIQANYVDNGSFAGTIKIQASNDGVNFVDIASSSVAVSVSLGNMWNYDGAYYRYVRAYLTFSAGSGKVYIYGNSKGLA